MSYKPIGTTTGSVADGKVVDDFIINVNNNYITNESLTIVLDNYATTADLVNSGGLPSQEGASGLFLTSNGTSASWASVPAGSGSNYTDEMAIAAVSATYISNDELSTTLLNYSTTGHNHTGVYADIIHSQAVSSIIGLQDILDSKQVTGDYATHLDLNGYSVTGHNHDLSYLSLSATGQFTTDLELSSTLLNYSTTGHNHTGVYADVIHSHSISSITNLQSSLDSKQVTGDYVTNAALTVTLENYATTADLQNIDALPNQASASGLFLTSNGTSASWARVYTSLVISDTAPTETFDGLEWEDTNTGIKYTWVEDGTSGQWVELGVGGVATIGTSVSGDSLPSQVGASGLFLTSNGTSASWASVPSGSGSIPAPTNITGRTSDYSLQAGETVYKTFSSTATIPLYISMAASSEYEVTITFDLSTYINASNYLNPNNTTYSNAVYKRHTFFSGATVATGSGNESAFLLSWNTPYRCDIKIGNYNNSKILNCKATLIESDNTTRTTVLMDNDWNTSTSWTSMGTIVLGKALSGIITIRRII